MAAWQHGWRWQGKFADRRGKPIDTQWGSTISVLGTSYVLVLTGESGYAQNVRCTGLFAQSGRLHEALVQPSDSTA